MPAALARLMRSRHWWFIFAVAGCLLFGVMLAPEQTTAQTTWTFNATSSNSPVPSLFELRTCRNLAVASTKGNPAWKAAYYRFTYPSTFIAREIMFQFMSSQKSVLQPVYYNGVGMYVYYALADVPGVVFWLWNATGGDQNSFSSVATRSTPYHLLLDPAYPLLYVAGMDFVGIINISSPYNVTMLAQYRRSDVMTDALNYQLGLVDDGTRLVATASPSNSPIAHLIDLAQDLSAFAPSRSFSASATYCTGVVVDPLGKYLLCIGDQIRILQPYSPYNMIGTIDGSPIPTAGTFLGDNLITTYGANTAKVFALQNSSWTGTTQLVSLVEQSSTVNMSCNALSSMEWRDGMLYTADFGSNVSQSVLVTTTSGTDITGLTRSFPEAQACNKSIGSSSMPALAMTATVPLVLDAQNLLAVSKSQLRLYDGAKDLRWNAIRYTVTSISGSCAFQLYNNNSQTWLTTSTFLQTDIDDGMIRILPPASFQSQCAAGTATPFTGSFTYTARDVWTRTASGTVQFAVVCCPNTTQTISPSLTVASVGASPSTASQYCSVPMPGYYTDSLKRMARPCPYGTFKPQVGGGAMRDVCMSCPDGANTSSVASTSWSQCVCPYCYNGNPINITDSYTFSAHPLVSSPHADRPLLFTTAYRGISDLYLAFTPYLLSNATVSSSLTPFYNAYFGGWANTKGGLRITSGGSDMACGAQYILGADFYIQVWYFYWKGYQAAGLVPADVDLQSSTFARDQLLAFLLSGNDSFPTVAAKLPNMRYQATDTRLPILDIGMGTWGSYTSQFKNFWNVQVDDMIDDYQLVMARSSLQLTSTFAYNAIPQMSVTILTVDSLNATWTILQGTINCTWINHSLNYYDFDLATPFVGNSVTWAISDGTTNVNNWASATSFTHAQMTAGLVYLRMLVPQSAFSQNWFTLPFTVRNPMIRVAPSRISYLNFTLPPLPSNGALEVSSWKWITGGDSACTSPTYPALGTFSATATPGTRFGSAVAMLGNSIYIFGGNNCNAPSIGNDFWQFNLSSGLWGWIGGSSSDSPAGTYGTKGMSAAGNVPQGRAWGSMVADSSRNVIWLFGGQTTTSPYANDMWKYDLGTGYWTWVAGQKSPTCGTIQTTQNEPCPRTVYGGLAMDGANRVVLFSSNDFTWNSPMWIFDPVASKWTLLNPSTASNEDDWVGSDGVTGIIGGRWEHQVVITPENQLYVVFGRNKLSGNPYSNSIWRYNMSNSMPAYWKMVRSNQTVPLAVGLLVETAALPCPRGLFGTVADAFGNIYVTGGVLVSYSVSAADLLVYNILADTWMRLAGPDAATTTSNYPGLNVVKGAASSLNQLPASYTSSGLFLVASANPRYYTLFALPTTNGNTGVYSFDVYVPPSAPVIKSSGPLSYERWGPHRLILNSSLLRVVDYDSPASQLVITITSSPNATFLNLATGLSVTSFTYDALTNGSLIAMVVPPSFIGTSLQFSWTVTDREGHSASANVNVSMTCSSANTSPNCLCLASFGVTHGVCATCASNTYKAIDGNFACAPCPSNSTGLGVTGQTSAGSACQCNAGYYGLTSNGTICTACPTDTFKNTSTPNAASCTACLHGGTTNGATGQTACSAQPGFVSDGYGGFMCQAGNTGSSCTACAAGTYKNTTGPAACASCPVHSTSRGATGQSTADGACLCNVGYYGLTAGGTTCLACPVDTFKNTTTPNVASCSSCPNGGTTNGTTAQTTCAAQSGFASDGYGGFTCQTGHTGYLCAMCSSGSFKNITGPGACTICPTDTYLGGTGNTGPCNACPQGSSTFGATGQVSVDNCTAVTGWTMQDPYNYTCALGYGYNAGNCSCTACPSDTYKNVSDLSPCSTCESGYSTFGGIGLTACANFSCGAGATFQALNNTCAGCAQDTYKSVAGNAACTACPTGSTTRGATGGYSVTNCTALDGWYQLGAGNFTCNVGHEWSGSTCVACSVGYYKDTVSTAACSACPVGSTVNGTGSTMIDNCTALPGFGRVSSGVFGCVAGLRYNSSQTTCEPCPVNTFKATVDLATCSVCPVGSYTNGGTGGASVAACVALPGFVATGTGAFGCPPGSQVVNASLCVQCPSGSAQETPGLSACQTCVQGTSTFGMSGLKACLSTQLYQVDSSGGIECTAGYTSDGLNCAACPWDTFKASGGNASCTSCPLGQGTLNKTAQTAEDACSAFSSASTAGQTTGGVAIGAVIGGALAGIVALSMLALFVAVRMRSKRQQANTPLSKAHSSVGFPLYSQSSLVRPPAAWRSTTGTRTLHMNPLGGSIPSIPQTIKIGMKTSSFSSATATFTPTQNLAAFPGFLLINSRSGFIKKRQIAEGGFGKIFIGELLDVSVLSTGEAALESNRQVAIKLFESSADGPARMRQMADLENEAAVLYALGALSNVTKLIAVSKEPEMALVLRLYEESVYSVVHRSESSLREYALRVMEQSWIRLALRLTVDLLAGVDGMHSLSVCHLDIKPQNLLLERLPNNAFRLVIGDFGLARISKNTAFDNIAGRIQTAGLSIQYAAPEAYNVVRLLDRRVFVDPPVFNAMDVYSTAITMWEVFARRAPLAELTVATAELELVQGKRPALDQLPLPADSAEKTIMQAVTPLLERGWSSLQGRRPQAQAMYTALAQFAI